MKPTKKQITAKLFKKLSALRATLSNDERDILNSLIVTRATSGKGGPKEVEAHKFSMKATAGKVTSGKASSGKAGSKEVEAHKFNLKSTAGKATSARRRAVKAVPRKSRRTSST